MYNDGFEGINNITDVIPILNNYSTIYIAIGAKYITANYPLNITNTGMYQLVPEFILNKSFTNEESKILIIIIDKFNEEELINNNIVIRSILKDITNIHYIFINYFFDENIKNQIHSLIENITIQNIYIVDYVYFFNPNPKDEKNSKTIDNLLNQLLILLVNKYYIDSSFKLPSNKNIYKWLGNIDTNYISKFNFYTSVWCSLSLAKRSKDIKKMNFYLSNCLRITPEYL
jgi:hypothetical protein